MKTIALISTKGGSGKSTLTMNLAVAFAETRKVLVLDTDDQATISEWYTPRSAADNLELTSLDAFKLPEVLPTVEGFDLCLIDTQGRGSASTIVEAKAADFVLIPVRPAINDVRAAVNTVLAIKETGTPYAFISTQTHHQPGRAKQSENALAQLGPVCPVRIVSRASYQDAATVSQGVTELEPDGKASAEIRQLLSWLDDKLGGK